MDDSDNKNNNRDDSSVVGMGDSVDTESDTVRAEGDITQEQLENSKVPKQFRPYVFKKGISGNPGGRPKGSKSLKEFTREYLSSMPDDEKIDFLNSLKTKEHIWEMGEGKPDTKGDLKIEVPDNLIELIKHGTANKGGNSELPK